MTYIQSLENIENILLDLVIYQGMTISANGEVESWSIKDLMERVRDNLDEDEIIDLADKNYREIISVLANGHADLYFNPDSDDDEGS